MDYNDSHRYCNLYLQKCGINLGPVFRINCISEDNLKTISDENFVQQVHKNRNILSIIKLILDSQSRDVFHNINLYLETTQIKFITRSLWNYGLWNVHPTNGNKPLLDHSDTSDKNCNCSSKWGYKAGCIKVSQCITVQYDIQKKWITFYKIFGNTSLL